MIMKLIIAMIMMLILAMIMMLIISMMMLVIRMMMILADGRHDKDVAVEEYPSDQEEKTKQLRCNKSLALYCISLHFVQVPFLCVI